MTNGRINFRLIFRLVLILIALGLAARRLGWGPDRPSPQGPPSGDATTVAQTSADRAWAERRSGVVIDVSGVVERTLADDNDGSRHQRFIVKLPSGLTVLVAHNIDIASRVPVSAGDPVELRGQYEWNEKGGVVHWTHHDPDSRHPDGFIRHGGEVYR